MKKNIVAILLCITIASVGITGCGSKKNEDKASQTSSSSSSTSEAASSKSGSESTADSSQASDTTADSQQSTPIDDLPIVKDAKLEDCITLAKYKGIEVDKTITSIGDTDVDNEVTSRLSNTTLTEGTCEKGDTVTISYVGKVDGKAFDGGTSEGTQIELGNSNYIDGFDDGVVGMKIGEKKDLNLKFPDEYPNSVELQGKDVVFSVTLSGITRPFTELNEEYVQKYTEFDDVDAFKADIKKTLEESAKTTDENNLQSTVWQKIYTESTVKQYLQSEIDLATEQFETSMKNYTGMEMDEYIKTIGMTQEQYDIEVMNEAKNQAKSSMIANLIAEKEGFKKDDSDYKKLYSETAEAEGMDEDTFHTQYGDDVIDDYIAKKRVMNLILDEATITEVPAAETEAATTE